MNAFDDFASKVLVKAVAQVCATLGVAEVQENALNTLSIMVENYIESIGRSSHDYAERSGRPSSQVCLLDILAALSNNNLGVGSITWRDLQEFAFPAVSSTDNGDNGWNQPFRHSVQPFPVRKREIALEINNKETKTGGTIGVEKSNDSRRSQVSDGRLYIPSFLPPFPPSYTYMKSFKSEKQEIEQNYWRAERLKRKRLTEHALKNLYNDHSTDSNKASGVSRHFGEIISHPLSQCHGDKTPLRSSKSMQIRRHSKLKLKDHKVDKAKKDELILDGSYFEAGDN